MYIFVNVPFHEFYLKELLFMDITETPSFAQEVHSW